MGVCTLAQHKAEVGLVAGKRPPPNAAPSPTDWAAIRSTVPTAELVARLLPAARQGLEDAGVVAEEVDQLLAVVEARVAAGQTGAVWQRRALAALEPRHGREHSLTAMLERYLFLQRTGEPVHTWPLPSGR